MGNAEKIARAACFTGHRALSYEETSRLTDVLREEVAELARRGYENFYCGGALGFDLLAELAIIGVRENFPNIKLIIVQPCRNQSVKWRDSEKAEYRRVLSQADEVICLSEKYYKGCMAARNRYLVEHADICVAYLRLKHFHSGTAQTVRLAKEQGLEVIALY